MSVFASRGVFYALDPPGSNSGVIESSVQIRNGAVISARYNPAHWSPRFGEIYQVGDGTFYTAIEVPQGLVGIPGKFHGGFRTLIGTLFSAEIASRFGIQPNELVESKDGFKDSHFDGGVLHVTVKKNAFGHLYITLLDDPHNPDKPLYEGTFKTSRTLAWGEERFINISGFNPTHRFCCVGSCAVGSPRPPLGIGAEFSYDASSKVMIIGVPNGEIDPQLRIGLLKAITDDGAWSLGNLETGGRMGTTGGIESVIVNREILRSSPDLLIRLSAGQPHAGRLMLHADVLNPLGMVGMKSRVPYDPEINPSAEGSVTRKVGAQVVIDLKTDPVHAAQNLQAHHDILGPRPFHDLMETAQVPQDRLPSNLRRPIGYKVSCFGVAGLSDAGSRVLQSPFFQTENPFRSLSRSADRFASGVFGGVRSTLGMGLYDLLSGKSFNLEQLLTNTFGMLTVGALASSVINPSGFLGFTGHSLLTIGFNHLLSGDFSFSKEEVMTTLVSTLVGGSIEAGAMSGALKALGFAGKTFGHILSSQKTLGQVVETAFTQLTLGSLFSTLGLISSETTNQAMASFFRIDQPQPALIA